MESIFKNMERRKKVIIIFAAIFIAILPILYVTFVERTGPLKALIEEGMGIDMANVLSSPEEFQKKVKEEKKPVLVIFFDNESSKIRVKAYEKMIDNNYSTVLNYKVNCDDKIMSEADVKKYITSSLICCTGICNDTLKSIFNPGESEFKKLMDWLLKCETKNQ